MLELITWGVSVSFFGYFLSCFFFVTVFSRFFRGGV